MKLYFSPGACSLSPHIVAREAGVPLDLVKVDLGAKKIDGDGDFLAVNPKGYVPALQLDDGAVLTEGPAIVQYIADRKPDSELVPRAGTIERYRMQEMLGYISTEIHKAYSPLFNPSIPAETAEERKAYLKKRYKLLDERLADRPYLFGDKFTAADAYLFTVTNWAGFVKLDLSEFTHLAAFQKRVAARPAVQEAMRAEKQPAKQAAA
jgi:glutathione S-transferase